MTNQENISGSEPEVQPILDYPFTVLPDPKLKGAYTVTYPDLPRFQTFAAESLDEIPRKAREFTRAWVEHAKKQGWQMHPSRPAASLLDPGSEALYRYDAGTLAADFNGYVEARSGMSDEGPWDCLNEEQQKSLRERTRSLFEDAQRDMLQQLEHREFGKTAVEAGLLEEDDV